ncbi:DUF4160 domain-containing protein [Chromatium okenii]|uniref:DUF4160 domain-containing protein n=1 Tax=Chromatium okenii TaxID=61644 RepID=UPI0026EC7E3A|nr:DUF4160 domain-containing protein [Chromatium okenii]
MGLLFGCYLWTINSITCRTHLHVEYQEQKVVIAIPEGNVLEGALPAKKLRLVQA